MSNAEDRRPIRDMRFHFLYRLAGVCAALICFFPFSVLSAAAADTVIVQPSEASWAEKLGAKEVRRYIYLRTGVLLPIQATDRPPLKKSTIVIARKDRQVFQNQPAESNRIRALQPQNYLIKTVRSPRSSTHSAPFSDQSPASLLLAGGDDAGVLYAAYRFAELLGIRFYLHGDVIPDEQVKWRIPEVEEFSKPLFALRGIQPFHDFPEGPDWWNRDDYLAVIGQLPKLRMNFIGLHTYPEGRPNAEPTVWIGMPGNFDAKGAVQSSYPSSYQNTLRGNWGYQAQKTSAFVYGSAQLFERDDYGPEVMYGAMPQPAAPNECNQVFDRTSLMLRDAFSFAHQVGVKTCVGTETPLVIPKRLQERIAAAGAKPGDLTVLQEVYAGIFRRATLAYPLDYYWFWTPEDWTWSGTKDETVKTTMDDLFAAIAAHKEIQPPFSLATCGWVLGPQQDRALFDKCLPDDIAVSCINREVGKTPVEPGFAEVRGRGKWAIPWLEDDPALTSPQLWVGRMRRDAADALRYGCDGLMGIHWRTRVLAPNLAALAQAAWNQKPWVESYKPEPPPPKEPQKPGPVGGMAAGFPNNVITRTEDPTLYQTVRYNVSGYHFPASNGTCRVTLKFCEPHYGEAGKRVFDVKLQGQTVLTNLDIFTRAGKNRALDYTFDNVAVTNGWLSIHFEPRVEFPSIAAIEIEGSGTSIKVNCGGPAYRDYAADAPSTEPAKQVYAESQDFYSDWARHEFGEEAGLKAAAIFARVDCKLPVPSVWTDGPGGIQPDTRPWDEVKTNYTFVDEFLTLRPTVKGAGSLERYKYWASTFEYLRTIGELNCAWGEYNRNMDKIRTENDAARQKELARKVALPARAKVVKLVRSLFTHLLATVSTPGEMGTVANWNQHNLPVLLGKPGEALAKILGERLPEEAEPDLNYTGPVRIIVPTKRSSVAANEPLNLKIIILSQNPPRAATLNWRALGTGQFTKVPVYRLNRDVYTAQIPEAKVDFEYYVRVEPEGQKAVNFPPSAPKLNQTVVVCGGT